MYKYNVFLFYMVLVFSLNAQTENQIRQAKNFIKQNKLSEDQVKQLAKNQGVSEKKIESALAKGKNKIESQEKGDFNNQTSIGKVQEIDQNNSINSSIDEISNINDLPILKDSKEHLLEQEVILTKPKEESIFFENVYFGYDIFKRDPSLFQATSVGVVDPDYLIGPGDEIIVMLWGETQFRQVLKVDREGFIFLPELGQVFVVGLNLALLESKLYKVLSQAYSSLNPVNGKASSFLDVSLGNLRPLRIQVIGEVAQPGAYTVSPNATLFSSLYYFNGPTNLGSLRDIRLIRDGKKIASIDFYDFLLTGKKRKDEKLQLDDVIYIPKRLKTVQINGEINRPGIYELKDDESLLDLIKITAGLKTSAYLERAQIDRIIPFEEREVKEIDREFTDINIASIMKNQEKFKLNDGDKIEIFSILDTRSNVVQIEGSITRPGIYDIGDSLKLSELIMKAGDVLGDAYKERVDIVRTSGDFNEELIKLNLSQVISGDLENDILLQGLDRIKIYSKSDMIKDTYVTIVGNVKNQGRYALIKNMTVYDLIFKSGGFIDEEHKKSTYLNRAELVRQADKNNKKYIIPFDLGLVLQKQDIASTILEPNDFVRIYSNAEIKGEVKYVTISGHVKYPGRYELFEENMTLYDLIFKTAGLEDPIHKSKTFLDRADIIRLNENRINSRIIPFDLKSVFEDKNATSNIKLEPGDEIKIYSKEILNQRYPVTITGSIKNPGEYIFKENMSVQSLILEAGGLLENVIKYKIEISRIESRNKELGVYAKTFEIEMNSDFSILNKKDFSISDNKIFEDEPFLLNPFDVISIRPDPYFKLLETVEIQGAVRYPGDYAILNPEETIYDIIVRAGGLRENAFPLGSVFYRNGEQVKIDIEKVLKSKRAKENMVLLNGDLLIINEKPNLVSIVGEVNVPGLYKHIKGRRVSDLIALSGGFTPNADKKNVFIEFPNGRSKKYSRIFKNPKTKDASIIKVGKKPEEEPFDKTQYFKDLTVILINFAQAVSLLILAKA